MMRTLGPRSVQPATLWLPLAVAACVVQHVRDERPERQRPPVDEE